MPFTEGVTEQGWGVVRSNPWQFAGIFPNRQAAEARARELGSNYEVHFGENQAGTDNFIWSTGGGTH